MAGVKEESTMKKLLAIAALAAAFAAPSALAGEGKTFAEIDTDGNAAITLAEVQVVNPEMTAEKFAKYDTDASGDLSEAEYDAWKAAKKGRQGWEQGGVTPTSSS